MKKSAPEKIDFAVTCKDLYSATAKIKEVTADQAVFLSTEGIGEPGGAVFQNAIQQIYSLAYTTKFRLKFSGKLDFAVGKLECLWHGNDFENTPKSEWHWQLLIRLPREVTEKDLGSAREEVRNKRQIDASGVRRWTWKEGRCLQVMHIGPYDAVSEVYRRLDAHAKGMGLISSCPGHEIYISDPRRVAPEKLKTIIRLPVKRAR